MSLPYNPKELHWNSYHTINKENKYCYCGNNRTLIELNLQCMECKNWYHEHCLKNKSLIPKKSVLPFITNYRFICSICNREESFSRVTSSWKDAINTAFANLTVQKMKKEGKIDANGEGDPYIPDNYWFDKKMGICPFLDKHWEKLCTNRARTPTWWATVGSSMYSSKDQYVAKDEENRSASSDFTLSDKNLFNLRPSTGSVSSQSQPQKKNKVQKKAARAQSPTYAPLFLPEDTLSSILDGILTTDTMTEHPYNRNGYKYDWIEEDPLLKHIHFRKKNVLNSQGPGVFLSRLDRDPGITLKEDGLTATTDKGFRTVRANFGVKEGNWYFEVNINKGGEKDVINGPNVRIGWTRREATLYGPVGYDSYGYGYRDRNGDKLHESLSSPYGESYGSNDVIGCYISLPKQEFPKPSKELLRRQNMKLTRKEEDRLLHTQLKPSDLIDDLSLVPVESHSIISNARKRTVITFKQRLYAESLDYLPINSPGLLSYLDIKFNKSNDDDSSEKIIKSKHMLLNKGSSISFYKNGVNQGTAFEDIPLCIPAAVSLPLERRQLTLGNYQRAPILADDGSLGYYPTISLFKGGNVTMNFGPKFKYPPKDLDEQNIKWKPMSERYLEIEAEEALWDIVDEVCTYFDDFGIDENIDEEMNQITDEQEENNNEESSRRSYSKRSGRASRSRNHSHNDSFEEGDESEASTNSKRPYNIKYTSDRYSSIKNRTVNYN
jgi:COMPASS component BRE2